jgi:hypothetical protein
MVVDLHSTFYILLPFSACRLLAVVMVLATSDGLGLGLGLGLGSQARISRQRFGHEAPPDVHHGNGDQMPQGVRVEVSV